MSEKGTPDIRPAFPANQVPADQKEMDQFAADQAALTAFLEGREEELSAAGVRALWRRALKAAARSYSPYSHFRVGAALAAVDEAGTRRLFTGVNVENSSYGAAICAERTACVKAVSEGCRRLLAIAVASPDGDAPPCGICRQFLSEFGRDMEVITGTEAERLARSPLSDLLPAGFSLKLAGADQAAGKEE